MTPVAIDWLVLTGGAASRLGQDKASTRVVGRSMRERVHDAICSVDEGPHITDVGRELQGGPAAAIVAMLPECTAPVIGVVAVDMPFAESVLGALVAAASDAAPDIDAWVPRDDRGKDQWLCALYRRSALVERAVTADWHGRRFGDLLTDMNIHRVPVDEGASLIDIDTPEDLQRAIAIAGGGEREDRDGR